MTILRPHIHYRFLPLIIVFAVFLLGLGVFYIFSYNALVNAKFKLSALKTELTELQTKNADLKNKYYKALDTNRMETLAKAQGLVLDRQPRYLITYQWLSDSSR